MDPQVPRRHSREVCRTRLSSLNTPLVSLASWGCQHPQACNLDNRRQSSGTKNCSGSRVSKVQTDSMPHILYRTAIATSACIMSE